MPSSGKSGPRGPRKPSALTNPNVRPRAKGPGAQNRKPPPRKPSNATPRPPPPPAAGQRARDVAVEIVWRVMSRGRFLDDAVTEAVTAHGCGPAGPHVLEARDRAFARLLATTVLRRHGELGALVDSHLERPLPETGGRIRQILLAGAAQLVLLKTPPHAAIDLAVEQCKADPVTQRFAKLTNAVLRRISETGVDQLAALDAVTLNVPGWLMTRWSAAYGESVAREIAAACLIEPPLDITAKSDVEHWAEKLGGIRLPTDTIRISDAGRVTELEGFEAGAWWVQDVAAALPARLTGAAPGLTAVDLCAAPGGKAAQLAAMGAAVTAVDISPARLDRVRENFTRLGLMADYVAADAAEWSPGTLFDCVLLDAPCTATGTIRRHPDILHIRQERGFAKILALQARLLKAAAGLVRPGGILVYGTCSLEPEEGEHQVAAFLDAHPDYCRVPVAAQEIGGLGASITKDGDVRTLPSHGFPGVEAATGMDGFFAARLRRRAS